MKILLYLEECCVKGTYQTIQSPGIACNATYGV